MLATTDTNWKEYKMNTFADTQPVLAQPLQWQHQDIYSTCTGKHITIQKYHKQTTLIIHNTHTSSDFDTNSYSKLCASTTNNNRCENKNMQLRLKKSLPKQKTIHTYSNK